MRLMPTLRHNIYRRGSCGIRALFMSICTETFAGADGEYIGHRKENVPGQMLQTHENPPAKKAGGIYTATICFLRIFAARIAPNRTI